MGGRKGRGDDGAQTLLGRGQGGGAVTTIADLDLARQAEHDRIETDSDLDAFSAASYWRALRSYGVPWIIAAMLVVRRDGAPSVVVQFAESEGEDGEHAD